MDGQGQRGCAGGEGKGDGGNQCGDGENITGRPGTSRPGTSRSARFECVGVVNGEGVVPGGDGVVNVLGVEVR